jgi:hypothetical protein
MDWLDQSINSVVQKDRTGPHERSGCRFESYRSNCLIRAIHLSLSDGKGAGVYADQVLSPH